MRRGRGSPVGLTMGFTLVELVITLAILATLSALLLPVAQVQVQRTREQELRVALREIRSAIDEHKRAADAGRIRRESGTSGYPADLETLVRGVEDQRDPSRRKIYFLRRLPADPMNDGAADAGAGAWGLRSYASEPDDPQPGADVYDVFSRSPLIGLNGVPYRRW